MSSEELYNKIGASSDLFESELKQSFQETVCNEDGEMLEYLVYSLFLCESAINLSNYNGILNKLIVSTWHEQHENIAMLLQKFKSPTSVDVLYETATKEFKYLEYDEAYALAVKCIWALGDIGTEQAKEQLELLLNSSNHIIKENAQKQIDRIKSKM